LLFCCSHRLLRRFLAHHDGELFFFPPVFLLFFPTLVQVPLFSAGFCNSPILKVEGKSFPSSSFIPQPLPLLFPLSRHYCSPSNPFRFLFQDLPDPAPSVSFVCPFLGVTGNVSTPPLSFFVRDLFFLYEFLFFIEWSLFIVSFPPVIRFFFFSFASCLFGVTRTPDFLLFRLTVHPRFRYGRLRGQFFVLLSGFPPGDLRTFGAFTPSFCVSPPLQSIPLEKRPNPPPPFSPPLLNP